MNLIVQVSVANFIYSPSGCTLQCPSSGEYCSASQSGQASSLSISLPCACPAMGDGGFSRHRTLPSSSRLPWPGKSCKHTFTLFPLHQVEQRRSRVAFEEDGEETWEILTESRSAQVAAQDWSVVWFVELLLSLLAFVLFSLR